MMQYYFNIFVKVWLNVEFASMIIFNLAPDE